MNKKIFLILLLICSILTASCGNNDVSADVSFGDASQTVSAEISEEAFEESENSEESITEESIAEESIIIEESEVSLPEESEEESVPPPAVAVTEELGTTEKGFKIFSVDGVVYIEGVLIVNKTYPLPQSYCPNGMTAETRDAFIKMCAAAKEEGHTLFSENDFRSYELQSMLYTSFCNRDGKEQADRYSARPGHSEHQSGMAIDINKASPYFNNTPEAIWLKNNCAEYGFIIRYPEGKESITGYMYESWHVRYVGKELAQRLYLGDGEFTTLEEYFGITSQYADQ
ncbi:MAG: M15 family metallopeptidase [Clostridia bacterium]|nr:M15 family metallopeptidase [Clostridia bacterium]